MTKPRRRPRALTEEERRLWAQVVRGVAPMPGRGPFEDPEPEPAPTLPAPPAAPRPAPKPAATTATTARPPAPPPLAPIERTLKTRLRRGTLAVDAAIDLHGMRQAEAHGALLRFLHRSQGMGCTLVLVVTGKGAAGLDDLGLFEERGVLRRVVPHWLRLPDLRALVLGFEEAAPHHGGSGALYVRLRRRRAGAAR